MKRKKVLLFGSIAVICIAGILTAGAASRQEKAERLEKGVGAVLSPTSHALTKKYMYEDYDAFWKTVEENYPFWRVAEEATGNDLEKIKEEYRTKIEEIENDWQFNDLISECVEAFGGVGHMQPITQENFYFNVATKPGEVYKEKKDVRYNLNKLNNEKSKIFYQYDEKEEKKVLDEAMEANSIPIEKREVSFSYEILPEEKTAVIEIPSFILNEVFGQPEPLALKKLFCQLEEEGIENCIIDIRRNGGGNDVYWLEGIIKPNLMKDVSYETYFLYKGEESRKCAELNGSIKDVEKDSIANLPELNQTDFEDTEYVGKNEMVLEAAEEPLFTGHFFVLTSDWNYSSAESFVRTCKKTGFATTIGTRTNGDGGEGNMPVPMWFVLPNSGICYRFSLYNIINPDGSNNEEYGTEPDIEVGDRDALEVCLDYIRNNRK